jgi:hypothetical protein
LSQSLGSIHVCALVADIKKLLSRSCADVLDKMGAAGTNPCFFWTDPFQVLQNFLGDVATSAQSKLFLNIRVTSWF